MPVYLSVCLSIYLYHLPTLPTFLAIYLPVFLPTFLPAYLYASNDDLYDSQNILNEKLVYILMKQNSFCIIIHYGAELYIGATGLFC
jgi:hypothetical protein